MTRAPLVLPFTFCCLFALCAGLGLAVAGCGAAPRPIEVTEPWTSGDEQALGIEEPAPTGPLDDADAATH
jgi:hypothetical protein